MKKMIPFNKPYLHGRELVYIAQAVASGKISGDGMFTKKCHDFFKSKYGFKQTLLTTSCTDALEMAAILLDIKPGDEIIVPSYTFVSTVNAFVLRGAKLIFVDSCRDNPNIDAERIEELITPNTRAIVVVHYAGVACNMDLIQQISERYDIPIVEDAAQAIESFYKGIPLGSFGKFSTFSFHETKNVIAGEGGLLVVNDENYYVRAEIIREKGTNRSAFFRGEVDKYGWVDVGSSFLPSDIIAAYLFAQLEVIQSIQFRRKQIWDLYASHLEKLSHKTELFKLGIIPDYATNNYHMFYLVCKNVEIRSNLIEYLKVSGINAVFHYLSLHKSPYYLKRHDGRVLPNADMFSDCLVRLPMYYELTNVQVEFICDKITDFFYESVVDIIYS